MRIRLVVNSTFSQTYDRGGIKECWKAAYSAYRFYDKSHQGYYAEFRFHPVNSLALYFGDRLIVCNAFPYWQVMI